MFLLQMIQSLKALIENADAVYEKIVHCQKAGKVQVSFLYNKISSMIYLLLNYFIYLVLCQENQT